MAEPAAQRQRCARARALRMRAAAGARLAVSRSSASRAFSNCRAHFRIVARIFRIVARIFELSRAMRRRAAARRRSRRCETRPLTRTGAVSWRRLRAAGWESDVCPVSCLAVSAHSQEFRARHGAAAVSGPQRSQHAQRSTTLSAILSLCKPEIPTRRYMFPLPSFRPPTAKKTSICVGSRCSRSGARCSRRAWRRARQSASAASHRRTAL